MAALVLETARAMVQEQGIALWVHRIFLKKTYRSISGIKGGEWKISALFKFGAG